MKKEDIENQDSVDVGAAEVDVAPEEVPMNNRRRLESRLKERYPDEEYSDDEALFGRVNSDYDDSASALAERDEKIAGYEDERKKLGEMLNDPRGVSLMMDMNDGKDPVMGLIRRFGPELLDALQDPNRQEEFAAAQAEYMKRVAENQALEEQWNKNLEETVETLDRYKEANGMSDDEINELLTVVLKAVNEMLIGRITEETLDLFNKGTHHESDVENALAEGEVRGRNSKISEKLRRRKEGDGIPTMGGEAKEPLRELPGMGALNGFGPGRRDIFARGGEKRIKH